MICHSEFDTRSAQHLNPMQGLLRLDQSQEMKDSVEYTDLLVCRNDQERFAVHFPLLNQIPFVSDLPQRPSKSRDAIPSELSGVPISTPPLAATESRKGGVRSRRPERPLSSSSRAASKVGESPSATTYRI